jgi:hypothetical protein
MNDDLIEVDYSFRRAALIARGVIVPHPSDGWYGNVFNP